MATVQLASVGEAAVADAVAVALGLRGTVDDPQGAIVALLESKPWLLVLDNCEARPGPCAPTRRRPHRVLPELTVLATSRRRLGLAVEQLCPISPLSVPGQDQRSDLDVVPAVALFVERAARARQSFQPQDEDLATVAGIVRRLDGLPLAIELAAGRLAAMGLQDVATRLDRALDLLAAAAARADGRHTSLRAALEWSYDLLTPDEQRLFRALSVFPDGFDLATAERIATAVRTSLDPTSVVAQLAEASMLVTSFGPTVRYRMLEMLRAFGLDRLAAHGELEEANARFLDWVEELLAWIGTTVQTEDEPAANERLLAEFDTIRAAWHQARRRTTSTGCSTSSDTCTSPPPSARSERYGFGRSSWRSIRPSSGTLDTGSRWRRRAPASGAPAATWRQAAIWPNGPSRCSTAAIPATGSSCSMRSVAPALFEGRHDEAVATAVEGAQLRPRVARNDAALPSRDTVGASRLCLRLRRAPRRRPCLQRQRPWARPTPPAGPGTTTPPVRSRRRRATGLRRNATMRSASASANKAERPSSTASPRSGS